MIFKRPGRNPSSVPKARPVKEHYVREVLEAIDELDNEGTLLNNIVAVNDPTDIEAEIERIVTLPYHHELVRNDDGSWFARIVELRGCMTESDTPVEALTNLDDAMREWVRVQLEDGDPIPLPSADGQYSGKFVVRVPPTLHCDLADQAEREGVSLNALATSLLARGVGGFQAVPPRRQ